MIYVKKLDHLVLTVRDIDCSVQFYKVVLGMEQEIFSEGRVALKFGSQKLNLHLYHHEFSPHANAPTPGSADLCFITETELKTAIDHVRACGVEVVEGPVRRTGANGPLLSFYFRDPDGNLIEVSNELRSDISQG